MNVISDMLTIVNSLEGIILSKLSQFIETQDSFKEYSLLSQKFKMELFIDCPFGELSDLLEKYNNSAERLLQDLKEMVLNFDSVNIKNNLIEIELEYTNKFYFWRNFIVITIGKKVEINFNFGELEVA